MLEQAACNEILSRLHHVLPHLERSPLLIEKCESLLPTHRIAVLVPRSYQMGKLISAITRSLSFLSVIALTPNWLTALRAPLKLPSEVCTLDTWNKLIGSNSPSKSPGGESCSAASYASNQDARRLPPCLRSVPMRLSRHRQSHRILRVET